MEFKRHNPAPKILIVGIPESEEKGKCIEMLLHKLIGEDFPNIQKYLFGEKTPKPKNKPGFSEQKCGWACLMHDK